MKRAVWNIVCWVSLLLCTVAGGLWVRSYRTLSYMTRETPYAKVAVGAYRGGIVSLSIDHPAAVGAVSTSWKRSSMSMADADGLLGGFTSVKNEHHVSTLGFHFIDQPAVEPLFVFMPSTPAYRVAAVPFWFLVTITALLPLARDEGAAAVSEEERVAGCAGRRVENVISREICRN